MTISNENTGNSIDAKDRLSHSFPLVWEQLDEKETAAVFEVAERYKAFITASKTERLCAAEILRAAEKNGYRDMDQLPEGYVPKAGDKLYRVNRGKALVMMVLGRSPLETGMHIVGSHIDAPRLDLKPVPLYEDTDMAFFKTHYYGGVKKYQWTSIPLALYGTARKENGELVDIRIGDDAGDPVLFITDLLPHLAKDQVTKPLGEAITGEGLNVLAGSIPRRQKPQETPEGAKGTEPDAGSNGKDKVKSHLLELLEARYGITERELITAELEIVPAGGARDVGLDRGMISSYGHDDRVCAFASLEAILGIEAPDKTAVAYFTDKEEVGSMGNTGAESAFFETTIAELLLLEQGSYHDLMLRRALARTEVLSADVSAGFDPNYAEAYDKRNSGMMGRGLEIMKYTGVRGKSGSSDANGEFFDKVARLFEANAVCWQVGELGKVDQGGGGTIAYILANKGAEVIDCGVPVLSMHAPFEVISKADLYMAAKGYRAFLNR
ncbi:aminopeptidase [Acidaminobacter hydrogenoformans]|uniref:M18 family aminopeptidase n=1 Tax=Acidaminobacter hydrogenoformans DSM 2784 TaxID=1120920 RepID=A0A1G5RTQ8_9FIRM|nr:aminopeptidase [Acidaminobacter hydrogenoformans]SCZ77238.1 Aspartyl aminopeptidase [Acidaminobacter hydrogenoformans DSM 2784]